MVRIFFNGCSSRVRQHSLYSFSSSATVHRCSLLFFMLSRCSLSIRMRVASSSPGAMAPEMGYVTAMLETVKRTLRIGLADDDGGGRLLVDRDEAAVASDAIELYDAARCGVGNFCPLTNDDESTGPPELESDLCPVIAEPLTPPPPPPTSSSAPVAKPPILLNMPPMRLPAACAVPPPRLPKLEFCGTGTCTLTPCCASLELSCCRMSLRNEKAFWGGGAGLRMPFGGPFSFLFRTGGTTVATDGGCTGRSVGGASAPAFASSLFGPLACTSPCPSNSGVAGKGASLSCPSRSADCSSAAGAVLSAASLILTDGRAPKGDGPWKSHAEKTTEKSEQAKTHREGQETLEPIARGLISRGLQLLRQSRLPTSRGNTNLHWSERAEGRKGLLQDGGKQGYKSVMRNSLDRRHLSRSDLSLAISSILCVVRKRVGGRSGPAPTPENGNFTSSWAC